MRIIKPKLNSKLILRLTVLGFSIALVTYVLAPRADRIPGQIAGTGTSPLLVDNKFCDDPSNSQQQNCTSFINLALAQGTFPYQNVNYDVAISGKVGIGTASPAAPIHVQPNNGATGDTQIGVIANATGHPYLTVGSGSNAGGYIIWNQSGNSELGLGTHGTTATLNIKASKVGIGTASPTGLLEVTGVLNITSNTNQPGSGNSLNMGYNTSSNIGYIQAVTYGTANRRLTLGGGSISFQTVSGGNISDGSSNLRMIIDGSGNVGIGTASPGYKLDVSGDIRSTGTIRANANGTSYLCGGDDACLNDVNIANTVGIRGVQNGGGWGSVNAAAFNVQSSRRFKTNIRNSRYGLDAVLALQGVDFSYIDPNQTQDATGFIAEDVAGIYPYAVQYDNGLASSLDYSKFAPLFVNAIKEQQKQITSLLNIIDYVNKIGRFIKVETQKLIVSGVDILEKLNSLSQKVEAQQKEIDLLKQQIEALKAR